MASSRRIELGEGRTLDRLLGAGTRRVELAPDLGRERPEAPDVGKGIELLASLVDSAEATVRRPRTMWTAASASSV